MSLKNREKICIYSTNDFEIDLKRLKYRLKLDSDQKTIKSAVHIMANMYLADFIQVIQAYSKEVKYYNRLPYVKGSRISKIEKAGGIDTLLMCKLLGYSQQETAEIIGYNSGAEISKWLKRRGLNWKDLK